MAKRKRAKRSGARRASGKRAGRSSTTRKRSRRNPPAGFATWKAYMASIRPGGSVAKKRGGRKRSGGSRAGSARKRSTRRRRGASSYAIRGGGSVFGVKNIMGANMRALISSGTQIGGEIATGVIRSRVLPRLQTGTVMATLADLAIGNALGLAAQKFLGRQVGQDVITGVYQSAVRRTVKQLNVSAVNSVLGANDAGAPRYVQGPDGRWVPLGSWPGTGDQRLAGYVGTGDQRAIPLAGEMERELYGADV